MLCYVMLCCTDVQGWGLHVPTCGWLLVYKLRSSCARFAASGAAWVLLSRAVRVGLRSGILQPCSMLGLRAHCCPPWVGCCVRRSVATVLLATGSPQTACAEECGGHPSAYGAGCQQSIVCDVAIKCTARGSFPFKNACGVGRHTSVSPSLHAGLLTSDLPVPDG